MAKLQALIEAIDVSFNKESEHLYVSGIFISMGRKNQNGRNYLPERTIPIVEKYKTTKMKEDANGFSKAIGELDHPYGEKVPSIHLKNASHRIIKLEQKGNDYVGKALILDTPSGLIVQELHNGGVLLGASSRALGTLDNNGNVNPGMVLVTPADIVSDPSAVDAMLTGIYESKDIYNTIFGEERLQNLQSLLKNKNKLNSLKHSLNDLLGVKS